MLNDLLEDPSIGPFNAWQIASLAAALGENDIAFEYLNREPHHAFVAWAAVVPVFNSLHNDPRFTEFVEELNLPD